MSNENWKADGLCVVSWSYRPSGKVKADLGSYKMVCSITVLCHLT